MYRRLYGVFDPSFIHDSYSSRNLKGTHAGVERLQIFAQKVTSNFRRQGYVLKCDIKKFFDSIDHHILLSLIREKVADERLFGLVVHIVRSFETSSGKGLPLGNVTSQLFSNIYLNELDQFIKHRLRQKYYIRYCDDFVFIFSDDPSLTEILRYIVVFLRERLFLSLHPVKIEIRKLRQGVDFLGYVVLPHRTVLRTRTKHRMLSCVNGKNLPSYLGMLSHSKAKRLELIVRKKLEAPSPKS